MAYNKYHQLRVLVIDDFKQFLDTLCSMLETFGVMKVDTVTNGNQAVKLCAANSYDLVLCDYNLGHGKKTGLHILELFRKNDILKNHAPFLLITAEVSKNMVMATYDYAPDAYLTKPFSAAALKQRLDKLFSQRESMIEIYQAEERNDIEEAIRLCEKKIADGDRYSSVCRKILGELYIRHQSFDLAERVYTSAFEQRSLAWAKMGLAQVLKGRGEMVQASECLQELIVENPSFMQAYDLLAQIQEEVGDASQSQLTLKKAVNVSPLSILRQQRLGNVAKINGDLSAAADAYQCSVELGQHSCYDSVDVHLNFGRTTAALLFEKNSKVEALPEKALKDLKLSAERFEFSVDQEAQFLLVKSQIYQGLQDSIRADKLFQKAEKIISEYRGDMNIDTQLDLVQTLSVTDKQKCADDLLGKLAVQFSADEKALEKIDPFLDEPKSGVNRKRVAVINREGIGLYKQRLFQESIACFERAQRIFPKHTGIHLNLVQSLMGEMQENGFEQEPMDQCHAILEKIMGNISSEHKSYSRCKSLSVKAQNFPRLPRGDGQERLS